MRCLRYWTFFLCESLGKCIWHSRPFTPATSQVLNSRIWLAAPSLKRPALVSLSGAAGHGERGCSGWFCAGGAGSQYFPLWIGECGGAGTPSSWDFQGLSSGSLKDKCPNTPSFRVFCWEIIKHGYRSVDGVNYLHVVSYCVKHPQIVPCVYVTSLEIKSLNLHRRPHPKVPPPRLLPCPLRTGS